MPNKSDHNLVIFSTLNQITNYLAIKSINPDKVYNITYDEKYVQDSFSNNIKPHEWDENLKKCIDHDKENNISFENIKLGENEHINISIFKKRKLESIDKENKEKSLYWNITGGQRIFLLPVYEMVMERRKRGLDDEIFYLEGNSNKCITFVDQSSILRKYEFFNRVSLDFNKVYCLMGYETKDLKSTLNIVFGNETDNNFRVEKRYYLNLYNKIYENKILDDNGNKIDFLKELSKSNQLDTKDKRFNRIIELLEYINNNSHTSSEKYIIKKSKELDNSFPAGYVFEKIVGWKIYDIVKKLNEYENRVLRIAFSQKIYNDETNTIVDELDIVLLTNTGKIINFECKTGSMSGDNAKSHNFTTYSLSGVFGTPIFLTPVYSKSGYNDLIDKDKRKSAIDAANRAKINTIYFNDLENSIKNYL